MADRLESLCETCSAMREIVTPKGSRFLLCKRSETEPEYGKYPRQPVRHCRGHDKGSLDPNASG